jgi:hypothetical protein
MLEAYDAHEVKMSLKLLAKDYLQTFLDPSFQRRGGVELGSGWSLKESQNYLGSLIACKTCNTVIRAHVEENIRWWKEQNDKESLAYYQARKDAGHKHVIIDGHNSSSSIYHFAHQGLISRDPITNREMALVDFSEADQDRIMVEEKILVITLRRISYRDLCFLFRNVNTNVNLNRQEYRQAQPTKLAAFVRDISNGGPNV